MKLEFLNRSLMKVAMLQHKLQARLKKLPEFPKEVGVIWDLTSQFHPQ
jgi:hypothetical protein